MNHARFNQRCGQGNLATIALAEPEAHQLFGAELPNLLNELNEALAV
jgi:hypothetical protein